MASSVVVQELEPGEMQFLLLGDCNERHAVVKLTADEAAQLSVGDAATIGMAMFAEYKKAGANAAS